MVEPLRISRPRPDARGLRFLLAAVKRLTGVAVPPAQALEGVISLLEDATRDKAGPQALTLCLRDFRLLREEYLHQALLDRMAGWDLRAAGIEGGYKGVYSWYVAEAQAQGFTPYSLKSFMNRAFRDPLELRAEAAEAWTRRRRNHAA